MRELAPGAYNDLKRIAITHGHRSHLGGLAALKRESGATVYAHAWEADIVSGDRGAQPVSLLPRQSLRLIPFQLGLWLGRPKQAPCPVDELAQDDDAIGPLQVVYAPGHSPGHLAFAWPERRRRDRRRSRCGAPARNSARSMTLARRPIGCRQATRERPVCSRFRSLLRPSQPVAPGGSP